MKFVMNKNNSDVVLLFEDDEIKTINEKKQLIFSPEFFNHFGNTLVHLVSQYKFHVMEKGSDKEIESITSLTFEGQEIKTK